MTADHGPASPAVAAETPAALGPILFARYAYPPNSLGYCGPSDSGNLLEAAAGQGDAEALGRLAAHFEGAWPYLRLIAASSGIDDPLDARVVEAYWVGNELVEGVSPAALAASLSETFRQPAAQLLAPSVPAGSVAGVAQHSFHVFAVYPWLRMLRSGREGPPLEVLDRCRIRWGAVETVEGDTVTVTSKGLVFGDGHLSLGPERTERVRRSLDGVGPPLDLKPGDAVSLHWDWVCDRLAPPALGWLQRCTERNLVAVNAPSS